MASEENPVVKAALELLPLYGVEAWRNNAIRVPGRRFNGKKGVGDVIGISRTGLFVSVECKKPGGRASDEQIDFRDMASGRGAIAIIADSIMGLESALAEYHRGGFL